MIRKIAAVAISSSVGFGTYLGLIFVFLKSNPTIDVPRGTIAPPSTELNLYKILSGSVKSKLLPKSRDIESAVGRPPFGSTNSNVVAPVDLIEKPGLLSTS